MFIYTLALLLMNNLQVPQSHSSIQCNKECAQQSIQLCEGLTYEKQPLHRRNNVVCFSGSIDEQTSLSFSKIQLTDGDILVARSGGGWSHEGLKIAQTIEGKNITTVIWDYCLSSCANYVFIPSEWKIAIKGSIIGFHGGQYHPDKIDIQDWSDEDKLYQKKVFDEYVALYERLGVSRDVCEKVPEGIPVNENNIAISFWIHDKNQLEAFGVTGILHMPPLETDETIEYDVH